MSQTNSSSKPTEHFISMCSNCFHNDCSIVDVHKRNVLVSNELDESVQHIYNLKSSLLCSDCQAFKCAERTATVYEDDHGKIHLPANCIAFTTFSQSWKKIKNESTQRTCPAHTILRLENGDIVIPRKLFLENDDKYILVKICSTLQNEVNYNTTSKQIPIQSYRKSMTVPAQTEPLPHASPTQNEDYNTQDAIPKRKSQIQFNRRARIPPTHVSPIQIRHHSDLELAPPLPARDQDFSGETTDYLTSDHLQTLKKNLRKSQANTGTIKKNNTYR